MNRDTWKMLRCGRCTNISEMVLAAERHMDYKPLLALLHRRIRHTLPDREVVAVLRRTDWAGVHKDSDWVEVAGSLL
jgi:hypothetical protein